MFSFGGGASALAQEPSIGVPAARSPRIAIHPMTNVVTAPRSGYFSDPYPIHLASSVRASSPLSFSGTTPAILSCPGKIRRESFETTPLTVSAGPLTQEAAAYGSTISAIANNNIFQNHLGEWHMAASMYLKNPAYPNAGTWNVIVHAHPTSPSDPTDVPTGWVADTVLVGSFVHPAEANYDGKYFEDGGNLYLIYSMSLFNGYEDGIVAQLMQSPVRLAAEAPTVLINPDGVNGGFNSENYFGLDPDDTFKLLETGNVTKIQGKYVLAYSTGCYLETDYKAGVAWSDTFLPAPGTFYKKMFKLDTTGVWGSPTTWRCSTCCNRKRAPGQTTSRLRC